MTSRYSCHLDKQFVSSLLALLICPLLQASTPSPLQWEETTKTSEDNSIVFQAVNPTQTPIHILRIVPSCHCLHPSPSVWTIPPGGELTLKVPASEYRQTSSESTYTILVQTDTSPNESVKFWQAAFWATSPLIEPSVASAKLLLEGNLQRKPNPDSPLLKLSKKYQTDLTTSPEEAEKTLTTLSSYKIPFTDTLTATYNKTPSRQSETPPQKEDSLEVFGQTHTLVKEETKEGVQTKEYYPDRQGPNGWFGRIILKFYPNENSIKNPIRTYLAETTPNLLAPPGAWFSSYTENPELRDSIIQTTQIHPKNSDKETDSRMDNSFIAENNRFFLSEKDNGVFSISYAASGQDWDSLKETTRILSPSPGEKEAALGRLKTLVAPKLQQNQRTALFEYDKERIREKFFNHAHTSSK